MRSMSNASTSATVGTELDSTMVLKLNHERALTTISSSIAGTTIRTNNAKQPFRFPRFSIKSSSMGSVSHSSRTSTHSVPSRSPMTGTNVITPRTSRRLRTFALLRAKANPADNSETSPMMPQGFQSNTSSNSSVSTNGSQKEAREEFVMRWTKVVAMQNCADEQVSTDVSKEQPPQSPLTSPTNPEEGELQTSVALYQEENPGIPGYSCATAILQHSYLEMVCGRRGNALEEDEFCAYEDERTSPTSRRRIPDDPTVQDSIECVFASQLQEGLPLWADNDELDDACKEERDEQDHSHSKHPINAPSDAELPSPAPLMQSRQRSRTMLPAISKAMLSSKRRPYPNNNPADHSNCHEKSNASIRPRKKFESVRLMHVGTYDPKSDRMLEEDETGEDLMDEDDIPIRAAQCSIQARTRAPGKCFCHSKTAPLVPPDYWPQAPLLLRPTPGHGMTVVGVRMSGQAEHFWTPANGGWWLTPLYERAGKEPLFPPQGIPSMCPQCCLLPINNGNEPVGEALVTDFETPLFEGSLLVRLRHVDGGATSTNPDTLEYDDAKGYFAGLNRRYQVVIRGKFKQELPFTGLVAGCVMDRPVGQLPPKWIMKGAVKVLSFFAPQLEVQMDCSRPKTMAPLGSTPQVLLVQEVGPNDRLPPLDAALEEPVKARESLMGEACLGSTSLQRARGRKKAFDKLYTVQSKEPLTKIRNGSKETYYTFEFLQHLVNFQDFSVELGNLLGSIPIAPILDGQPIPIMAMIKDGEHKAWSFDIWHQNLMESAIEHDAKKQAEKQRQ